MLEAHVFSHVGLYHLPVNLLLVTFVIRCLMSVLAQVLLIIFGLITGNLASYLHRLRFCVLLALHMFDSFELLLFNSFCLSHVDLI